MRYAVGTVVGAIAGFGLGLLLTRGGGGIAIFLFSIILGIPLGGFLGFLSVLMANKLEIQRAEVFIMITSFHFIGGIAGIIFGGAMSDMIYKSIARESINYNINGIVTILGLPFGGILGILLVNKIAKVSLYKFNIK